MSSTEDTRRFSGLLLLFLVSFILSDIVDSFVYASFTPQLIQCNSANEFVYPKVLDSIQDLVVQAVKANQTVKPLGSLHSGTDIICTTGIPIRMTQIKHFVYDPVSNYVKVGAGMKLLNFLEELHKLGRAIEGIPTYGDITIGGALATGSHGSGLEHPSTLMDCLVSIVLVDGLGGVRFINNSDTLRAFKTNMGLLGIIYEVTLKTVPQFKISIEHKLVKDDILWGNGSSSILDLAKSHYRFQLWWFPSAKRTVLSLGTKVGSEARGNCRTHFITEASRTLIKSTSRAYEVFQKGKCHLGMFLLQKLTMHSLVTLVPGRSPMFAEDGKTFCLPRAVGFSHRMLANRCDQCAWDHANDSLPTQGFAVAVPLEQFSGAMQSLRAILQESPAEFPLIGIFIRFISASDGLLSFNEVTDMAVIEWAVVMRKNRFKEPILGLATVQAMMQALVFKHHGRPHYAKNGLFYFNKALISNKYPNYYRFLEYAKELDPHGIFLNDFGRRILSGETQTLLDKEANHCALIDNCICSKDSDCGTSEQPIICGSLQGFKVCRESYNLTQLHFKSLKSHLVRKIISRLT